MFSLSARLKPINGSLSGCALAVCSRIQRQIGLSRACLGSAQQGVGEERLNKCVFSGERSCQCVCCWMGLSGHVCEGFVLMMKGR